VENKGWLGRVGRGYKLGKGDMSLCGLLGMYNVGHGFI
jgi:hypothetical protein